MVGTRGRNLKSTDRSKESSKIPGKTGQQRENWGFSLPFGQKFGGKGKERRGKKPVMDQEIETEQWRVYPGG